MWISDSSAPKGIQKLLFFYTGTYIACTRIKNLRKKSQNTCQSLAAAAGRHRQAPPATGSGRGRAAAAAAVLLLLPPLADSWDPSREDCRCSRHPSPLLMRRVPAATCPLERQRREQFERERDGYEKERRRRESRRE